MRTLAAVVLQFYLLLQSTLVSPSTAAIESTFEPLSDSSSIQQQGNNEDSQSRRLRASTVTATASTNRSLIVGGSEAAVGEFPYYISTTKNGYCGASLIAPNVALSAAHCAGLFAVGRQVLVGAVDRDSTFGGAQYRTVTKFVKHPDYNSSNLMYDFLLVQLDQPVTDVEPVKWNRDHNLDLAGTTSTVMGFGRIAFEDGETSEDKLKVDLEVVSDSFCKSRYGNIFAPHVMICALQPQDDPWLPPQQSACEGDSGGPLVVTATDGDGESYPLQIGVVSWGIGCGSDFYPGVYARPSGVVEWMDETICALSGDCDSTPAPVPPTPTGAPVVPPGVNAIKLEFRFDNNPGQTSWDFVQIGSSGAETIIVSGPDNNPGPRSAFLYTYSPFPSGNFKFVLKDSQGNGLQKNSGFSIKLETTVGETIETILLAEGPPSSFSSQDMTSFAVGTEGPSSTPVPTPEPTPEPTPPPGQTAPPMEPTTSSPSKSPTYTIPCVCRAGSLGCLEVLCNTILEDEGECKELGCTWLNGIEGHDGSKPPPNIEDPTDDDDDDNDNGGVISVTEEEEKNDAQKAGFSLLVGLAATLGSLVVLGGGTFLFYRHRENRQPLPSEAASDNYPPISKRGTGSTDDEYYFDE